LIHFYKSFQNLNKMSIIGAFSDLKKVVIKPVDTTNVSSVIFKLHRITSSFLICCSFLTTLKQHFGAPIHCMIGEGHMALPVFESYCFMRSTYTRQNVYPDTNNTHQYTHAYPGVTPGDLGVRSSEIYHNYYQWVCLLLVVQAALCSSPWFYWKSVERGRIRKLVEKISKDPLTEKPVMEQISGLGDFLINNTGWFNSSAFKMLWIELMCLVLTILQLYLMDVVLGNQFLNLGKYIFNPQELSVALYSVFPIVVSCDSTYFGPSGEVMRVSGLCTLPINILNEKIYLILWFWYNFLIITSACLLFWECFHILFPKLRLATLSRLVQRKAGSVRMVRAVLHRSSYGDFVLLKFIAKNIDTVQFSSLIRYLQENTKTQLPLHHNRSFSASILEPEVSPRRRILSNEKVQRGKEL